MKRANKKEIKSLLEQIKKNPTNLALRIRYGKLLFQNGDLAESEAAFQSVIKEDKENSQAKKGLIDIYFAKENYSAVIVIAEELTQKKQANDHVRILQIKALLRQNNMSEAQALYQKLLKHNPLIFDAELLDTFESGNFSGDFFDNEEDAEIDDPFGFEEGDDDWDDWDDYDEDYDELDRIDQVEMMKETLFHSSDLLFENINGMFDLKDYFQTKFIGRLDKFSIASRVELDQWTSCLLYGPSGCGKTYICNVLTIECMSQIIVPDIHNSIKNGFTSPLLLSFAIADDTTNSVLLLDPLEMYMGNNENINMLNHFFTSIRRNYHDSALIGITTKPWDIPRELFGYRKISDCKFVGPPVYEERKSFLQSHLFMKGVMYKKYLNEVTEMTKGFSYSELLQMIDKAIQLNFKKGGSPKSLSIDIITDAIASIDIEWFYWIEEFNNKIQNNPSYKKLYKEAIDFKLS